MGRPAFTGLSLPANRIGIDCNRSSTCMCPSGMRDDQAGTDFASYVAAWDPVCECGEGLAAPVDYSAAPDPSPSAPTQDESAACSTRVAGTQAGPVCWRLAC
ncbi:MAG: hypothetical protein R3E66_03945 [bacterium]